MTLATLAMVWLLSARPAHGAGDLPPLLASGAFPSDVRAEIARVWTGPTLTRAVDGQPARAPLEVYRLLVDHPEVTAGAARHLGLAKYRVEPLGPQQYSADDGAGATGTYHVIHQEPGRRVILARGSHAGRILGRIGGASLTTLSFEPRPGADGEPEVAQRVETFVRIDNQVAAFFARLLLPLFAGFVDRKIAETFNVTAKVSEWAHREPEAFCGWLRGPDGVPGRGEAFAVVLPACR